MICLGLAVGPALVLAPSHAAAVDLLPHRAIYEMSLGERKPNGDIVRATGRMIYNFAATCDGWTVENKTLLSLGYENGRDVRTRWSFASFEGADGDSYRFSSRYDQNGETLEKLRGTVGRASQTETSDAVFVEPSDHAVDLPGGTLFPTDHVKAMIEAAESGQQIVDRVVFDGASLNNPYFVNAVITRLSDDEQQSMATAVGLPLVPSWRIRMAFFTYHGTNELPEFEIEARYRADGVADDITQQFNEFSLRVRLESLETLDKPDC